MKNLPDQKLKKTITRRSFAIGAATAATTALIPAASFAQSAAPAPAPQQPSAMSKLSPDAQAEVEMKVNAIFRKYGSRLSDEQKADIRRIMAETQDGLEKMRAFALENGDQPATVFRPYRKEGRA